MDLDGGAGFDRVFLSQRVEPPRCEPAELLVVDGQVEIRYMHFSLAMHAERRLARWVAWNIDGPTRWDGDDIPREGLRFRPDPRVPVDAQITDPVYIRNRLDRGRLVGGGQRPRCLGEHVEQELARFERLSVALSLGQAQGVEQRAVLVSQSPSQIHRLRVDSTVEEADKTYFVGWRDNQRWGQNVTPANLRKTAKLIGVECARMCQERNISTCWSDHPGRRGDPAALEVTRAARRGFAGTWE